MVEEQEVIVDETILAEEEIEPFDWEDHLYESWLEEQGEKEKRKLSGSILSSCLTMGFTYRNQTEILHTIGRPQEIPLTLQRALAPGRHFEFLAEPKPGEWLAEHHGLRQTQ